MSMLRNHLEIPFYNNAYSLIGVQIASSILGVLFWAVVARFYTSDQVGLGTGIYSAALLLTGLAALGFGDGITYYLPRAESPGRLINAYFSVSGIVILGFSLVFILGQPWFSPELNIIRRSPMTVAAFMVCTLVLHLNLLQDALFVADRVSKYSLTKTVLANLLRLPLFALVFLTNEWSLIFSAVLAFLAGSLLAGRQYHRRERPGHRYQLEFNLPVWKPMLGFSFGNYVMNTVVSLPNTLLPLFVLNSMGFAANGYFYIAWMIGSLLAVVGRSFGSALFVESGRDQNSIQHNTIRSIMISSIVLLPGVSLLVVFSPQILSLFGEQYSIEATALVRLLLVSCIPLTFYGIFVGVLKSQGKVAYLIVLAVIFTGLHLGGAMFFGFKYGLLGIGWAVIVARTLALFTATLLAIHKYSFSDLHLFVIKTVNLSPGFLRAFYEQNIRKHS